jgi:hypothetical protein
MKHKPAMYALLDLHSTLGGEILRNKDEAERLRKNMQHVEAVIKMLEPQFSLRRVAVKRRKANQWFRRGTLYRKAVDVLRTAEQPMTATDIAWAVLNKANIQTTDKKAVQALGQGIQSGLRKHKGKSVEVVNDGFPALWRLGKSSH